MELNGYVVVRANGARHINMVGYMAEGFVMLSAGAIAACGEVVCVVDHSLSSCLYMQAAGEVSSDKASACGAVLGSVYYRRVSEGIIESSDVVIHYYDVVGVGCDIDADIPTYLILDNDMRLSIHSDVIYKCALNLVIRDDLGEDSLYSDSIGLLNFKCNRLEKIYWLPLCREDKVCEVRARRFADYGARGLSIEYRGYLKGLCRDAGVGELDFLRFLKISMA